MINPYESPAIPDEESRARFNPMPCSVCYFLMAVVMLLCGAQEIAWLELMNYPEKYPGWPSATYVGIGMVAWMVVFIVLANISEGLTE